MKRLFLSTAVLAVAACSDTGPVLEGRSLPGDPAPVVIPMIPDKIFTTQVPETTLAATGGWEVGTVFTIEDSIPVTGFRYYKAVGETGSHTARLWTTYGTQLVSRAFTGETASGWQTTTLLNKVWLQPGTYVVSVNTNTYQVKTGGYFYYNGPIYRPYLVATEGRYGQPTGSFPSTSSTSAFFVDVLYSHW